MHQFTEAKGKGESQGEGVAPPGSADHILTLRVPGLNRLIKVLERLDKRNDGREDKRGG